jgi:hypothetical protein
MILVGVTNHRNPWKIVDLVESVAVLSRSESEAEASFCEGLRRGGDIAARKERFLDVD